MRDLWYLVRFFQIVPPVPPLMTWTLIALTVVCAIALIADPLKGPGALSPILVLQSFAASSGFALPARRGHYDLLFTRGSSRTLVALAHWGTSVAPGLASWLLLALLEAVINVGDRTTLFRSGTLAALCVVSTLPWAITVALPRFSGGIGWLLVATTAAMTFSSAAVGDWTVESTRIEELAVAAWSFLVYPVAAVGLHLTRVQGLAILPDLSAALVAMVLACRWIATRDVPLEASQ